MMSKVPVLPVLSLIGGERDACAWWRVVSPCNVLRRVGYPAHYAFRDEPGMEELADAARVIVYPRQAWEAGEAESVVAFAHQYGRLVFGEYDDDIFMARAEQKSHEEMGRGHIRQATLEEAIASVRALDGVTVSSERLATVIETVAPGVPVRVVPNMVDLDYWARCLAGVTTVRHAALKRVTTVGWFGGDRYDADIAPLAQAWAEVARRTKAAFVIMGHCPAILADSVPADRLHCIPWMPIDMQGETPAYPVGIAQIDILCASVAPTRFNAAKTPIKWIEGTMSGAAVIGSPWLYGRVIEDGVTGLIADGPEEWARAIIRLVERPHVRRGLRARAMAAVRARHALQSPGAAGVARWPRAWAELAQESIIRNRWRVDT